MTHGIFIFLNSDVGAGVRVIMSSPEQSERKRTLFVLASVLQGRHAKRRAAVQSLVDVIQSDEDNDDERSAAVVEHALDALYEASVLAAIPLLAAVGCLLCICDLVPATHALYVQMRADPTRRTCVPFFEDMVADGHAFFARYRMPKRLFVSISRRLLPFVLHEHALTTRRFAIEETRETYASMVFGCLLLFLASPGQQRTLGDHFGVSQSCVSKWLRRGVKALLQLHGDHGVQPIVTLPSLTHFVDQVEPYFHRTTGVHYIGLIADGFHVAIEAPAHTKHQTEDFLCRKKGYLHSLNCFIMCDHTKYICFAEPKWPGSVNDRGMTSRSGKLRDLLVRRTCSRFPEPLHVLADSGFLMRKYFLMPFADEEHDGADPALTAANKKAFNTAICGQRVIVEQAIGLLKGKWQRLKNFRIHEDTNLVPLLVKCAIILHNICVKNNAWSDAEIADHHDEGHVGGGHVAIERDGDVDEDAVHERDMYKQRQIKVLKLWIRERYHGYVAHIEDLKDIYGEAAYV